MTLFAYQKPTRRYRRNPLDRSTYRIDYHASGPLLYRALEKLIKGPDLVNETDSSNPQWFTGRPSLRGTRILRPSLLPKVPLFVLEIEVFRALTAAGFPGSVSRDMARAIVDERTWWLYARKRTVTWEHLVASLFLDPKVDDHFLVRVESLEEKETRLKEEFRGTLHFAPILGAILQGAEVMVGTTVLGDEMSTNKRSLEGAVLLLSIAIPRMLRGKGSPVATADDLMAIHPRITRAQAQAVLRASRKITPSETELLRKLALRIQRDKSLILTKAEEKNLVQLLRKLRGQRKKVVKASLPELTTVDDAIEALQACPALSAAELDYIGKLKNRTLLLSETERLRLRDLMNKLEEPQKVAWAKRQTYQKFEQVLIGKGYGSQLELLRQELGGALFLSRRLKKTVRVVPEGTKLSPGLDRLTGNLPKSDARSADFVVEGAMWDFYYPRKSSRLAVDQILTHKRSQAGCFIIDLENLGRDKLSAYRMALKIYANRDAGRSVQRLIFVRRQGSTQILGHDVYKFELVADIPNGPFEILQKTVDALEKAAAKSSPHGGLIRGGGTVTSEPPDDKK